MNHLLLERIQRDATLPIKRWSMRELASQQQLPLPVVVESSSSSSSPSHNNHNQSTVSNELLQCVVQRLAVQHECLRAWKQALTNTEWHAPSTTTATITKTLQPPLYHSVWKRIDTLQYIHYDTYRIGQQILVHPSNILHRQTKADQHVIHTTFLEIRARHAKTIETMVDLVSDLRTRPRAETEEADDVDSHEQMAEYFLRRRIGIQLLCDHHVALHKGTSGIRVGAPLLGEVLPDAIQEAKHIVDAHLPMVPEIIVQMIPTTNPNHMNEQHQPPQPPPQHSDSNNHEMTCTMVQPWVHHAIVELLKNAMSSTIRQMQYENHTKNATTTTTIPTPVYIKCYDTPHSIIIDIVDAGTGMGDTTTTDTNSDDTTPRSTTSIQRAFQLGHTTAASVRYDRLQEQQSYAAVQIPPLSSLGVGLPLSQYFVEHFGGTLQLWNNHDPTKNQQHPSRNTTTTTTIATTTAIPSTGCTARIELLKDNTIVERFTPL